MPITPIIWSHIREPEYCEYQIYEFKPLQIHKQKFYRETNLELFVLASPQKSSFISMDTIFF